MPEQDRLYVLKRTILDPKNPRELTFKIALPETFTDLKAAKAEAKVLLAKEGYDVDFFDTYETKVDPLNWKYGDGVQVFAKAPSGEEFKVEIDTVKNSEGLKSDDSGKVLQPLHHVLQTIVEYHDDQSGAKRESIVEGTYADRRKACDRALRVLLDPDLTKEDYAEYDEYVDGTEKPFGPDVFVHAVKETGENLLVSVIADH